MRARIIRAYKPWRPRGVFFFLRNASSSNQIKSKCDLFDHAGREDN